MVGGKMFASSIGWILVSSGLITAGSGLAALFFPHLVLRSGFGVTTPDSSAVLFVQHWGVLVSVLGALIVFSAEATAVRGPVLVAAIVEKFAGELLIFFGPVKRTNVLTAIAIGDGILAILYIAYLAGR
jgi:hypothetical protein